MACIQLRKVQNGPNLDRFYLTYCDGILINTELEPLARPDIIEMEELVSFMCAFLVIGAVFSRR
jgi:hypothetical protein